MTPQPAFFKDALTQISRGVVALIGGANLQVCTAPLPRYLAGRLRGQLRGLEKLLRRVLMLRALALLPGLAPAAAKTEASAKSNRKPRDPLRGFTLLPAPMAMVGAHGFPDRPGTGGPVPLRKLFLQIAALQNVLVTPERHAQRLARRLRALMAAGEARPIVLPAPRPKRVSRELALIGDILPVHLRAALAVWPNTS